jgi:hypothetical protein
MTVPGQDPTAPSGETPPNPAPAPATPPVATGSDGEPFDAARAQRTIDALRNEIKELKPQAQAGKTAQQRLQELEDAQKTDLEKAQAKAAALEAQLTAAQAAHESALIRAAVEREAHQQGAVKADVVYRLIDRSGITLDDSGDVKGADKAVKALLEAEPYLKANTAGTTAVPGTPRANGQAPTRDQLVNEKYEKLKASGSYSRLG